MYRITGIHIALCLIVLTEICLAQTFRRGSTSLETGVELGVFQSATTIKFNSEGELIKEAEENIATSFVVPVIFEYGISEKWGVGFQIRRVNYLITNENSDASSENLSDVDLVLRLNYHLINSAQNDLFIGIALGGSAFSKSGVRAEEYLRNEYYTSVYITDRFFFNDYIGIFFNFGYTALEYSQQSSHFENANTFTDYFKWALKGVNAGSGLVFKF